MYLAFIGPYNETGQYPWDLRGVVGIRRFLERIWKLAQKIEVRDTKHETRKEKSEVVTHNSNLETLLHKTIKKVTEDIEAYKFNTAISAMMVLLNEFEKREDGIANKEYWEVFLKLLAPFAPHMAEEIWSRLGHKESIHLERWPEYDAAKIKEESVVIVIQIGGKVRGQFEAPAGIGESEAQTKALGMPEIQKWLAGQEIRKTIFVPNKIINFVI